MVRKIAVALAAWALCSSLVAGAPAPVLAAPVLSGSRLSTLDSRPIRAVVWSAGWCAPCKAMHPDIQALKREGWQILEKDFDRDEPERIAKSVVVVPTIRVGVVGEECLDERIGRQTRDALRAWFATLGVARAPPAVK